MWTTIGFIAAIVSYVVVATIAARWSMRRIERQRREIERELEDIQRRLDNMPWLRKPRAGLEDRDP